MPIQSLTFKKLTAISSFSSEILMAKPEPSGKVTGQTPARTGTKEWKTSWTMSQRIMKMAYSGWISPISFSSTLISIFAEF